MDQALPGLGHQRGAQPRVGHGRLVLDPRGQQRVVVLGQHLGQPGGEPGVRRAVPGRSSRRGGPGRPAEPIGTMSRVSRARMSRSTRWLSAPPRSILFTKMSTGMPSRRSVRISTRVWAWTPSTAEMTSTAPSSTVSTRSTSAMKSGWPGVSIRLTVTSPMPNDTTADLMVMPRCRSSASVSVWVLPLSTLPISSMTPAANSSRSVRLVLPALTWARMPRLRVLGCAHEASCPLQRRQWPAGWTRTLRARHPPGRMDWSPRVQQAWARPGQLIYPPRNSDDVRPPRLRSHRAAESDLSPGAAGVGGSGPRSGLSSWRWSGVTRPAGKCRSVGSSAVFCGDRDRRGRAFRMIRRPARLEVSADAVRFVQRDGRASALSRQSGNELRFVKQHRGALSRTWTLGVGVAGTDTVIELPGFFARNAVRKACGSAAGASSTSQPGRRRSAAPGTARSAPARSSGPSPAACRRTGYPGWAPGGPVQPRGCSQWLNPDGNPQIAQARLAMVQVRWQRILHQQLQGSRTTAAVSDSCVLMRTRFRTRRSSRFGCRRRGPRPGPVG